MDAPPAQMARRPLKSRDTAWAKSIAGALTRAGVAPNTISLASIAFAAAGAVGIAATRHTSPVLQIPLFLLGILGIQGRLLCNLFDGMVAIEGGKKSVVGDLYNELPDRVADTLLILATGYAATQPWGLHAGYLAALLAMLTATVRLLGKTSGAAMHYSGFMAKQKRMAVLTAACLLAPLLNLLHLLATPHTLLAALVLITLGCLVTVIQRLRLIVRDLQAQS